MNDDALKKAFGDMPLATVLDFAEQMQKEYRGQIAKGEGDQEMIRSLNALRAQIKKCHAQGE